MDTTALTQAQLDAIAYRAAQAAQAAVDAHFADLQKKALIIGGVGLVAWLLLKR